jgi:hypothetical protein
MEGLKEVGWKVRGVAEGGERIASASGLAEVRYGDPSDEEAAEALRNAIQGAKLTRKTMRIARIGVIPKGYLEVWISP